MIIVSQEIIMLKYVDRGIQVLILTLVLFSLLTVRGLISDLHQVKTDVVELTQTVKTVATAVTAEDFADKRDAVRESAEGVSDAVTDTKNRFINKWRGGDE